MNKPLDGYRKVKSTFVTPMNQMGNLQPVSYVRQILPQVIWWDLILWQKPHRFATKVAESIGVFLKQKSITSWHAFIADYEALSDENVSALRIHLENDGLHSDLQSCLMNFFHLYPLCPLARLFPDYASKELDPEYVSKFEERLGLLMNKTTPEAVFMMAQILYMGFVLDKIHIAEGLTLTNFPAIIDYPNTEESRKLASFTRSTVYAFVPQFLPPKENDGWVNYFWQRGLELKPINLDHLTYG